MKKVNPIPFLLILVAILLVMSLPRIFSEKGRGLTAAIFSPFWEQTAKVASKIGHFFNGSTVYIDGVAKDAQQEVYRIQTENVSLKRELKHLQEIIQEELYLHRSGVVRNSEWQKLLNLYTEAIPARVIYRNSTSWNSSFWINVGKKDNELLGKAIISKNSPVVIGYSLIGVIDFVGKNQSRVRLLTDSGFNPSVRSVRGEPKQRMLSEQLNLMIDALMEQDVLFSSSDQKMKLIERLEDLDKKLQENKSALYLAKGVLSGGSQPAWRNQGNLLKGTGFNCDFPDALSPARDLRTGNSNERSQGDTQPIIKERDLLVTTGMDGVFPPGLHVAEVVKLFPLKEGDYFYELEAKPVASHLDALSFVYVMPPLGYDPEDQPPLMGWE